MALSARQVTLVANAQAVPLIVQGTGTGFTFKATLMTLQDPLPVTIKNEDQAATVWIGGPDCDATHGQSLAPGATKTMNVYGNDIPYAFSTGTPMISVLAGRQ